MPIKYYPEDSDRGVGFIGLKFPLNSGNSSSNSKNLFNLSQTTEEQAVTNYVNLLLTKRGERYMQPEFGVGLQYYLFEPNTDATRSEIEFEIERQSAFWLPYIVNHKIAVRNRSELLGVGSDPENAIQIEITFSVLEKGANHTITIFEKGGNVSYEVF